MKGGEERQGVLVAWAQTGVFTQQGEKEKTVKRFTQDDPDGRKAVDKGGSLEPADHGA